MKTSGFAAADKQIIVEINLEQKNHLAERNFQVQVIGSRWSAKRKAVVVRAIRSGVISIEAACSKFQISYEEIQWWMRQYDRYGLGALRITKSQNYR